PLSTTSSYTLSLHDALPIFENHRSQVVGILLGVGRAYFGAVREAEKVDLVLAKRPAHNVHVARRRGGADVGEELAVHSLGAFIGDRKSTRLNSSHVAISYAV